MDASQHQRDYKTRNILSTAQRMRVLQAYDRTPNYQRLARMFGCSAKQIKNILAQKQQLLAYYKNIRINQAADEVSVRRQEKIDFLGKVVYEFLLRNLYLRIPVGTTIIRQKAYEIKEAIAIENFTPNQVWLEDFKSKYNRLDFANMMDDLPADMNKRQSLRTVDLIEYVSWQEKERSLNKIALAENENCHSMWGDNEYVAQQSSIEKYIQQSRDEYFNIYEDQTTMQNIARRESNSMENSKLNEFNNPPIEVKLELDEEQEHREEFSLIKPAIRKVFPSSSTSSSAPNKLPAQATPPPPLAPPALPDIHSYLEALSHLKVLEDFAMIEENYRAIGLISQLEQIFKNPPKLKRI